MRKILSVALLLSVLATTFAACGKKKKDDVETDNGLNFLEDDLSEYVEIEEKYYKEYKAEIDYSLIPLLVENEIIKVLCTNKDKENPVEDGDGVISVGDVVNIFYKGYYLQGEEKVYFGGGSNVGGSSYGLEIGSGGFIPGFEYNMIGKNPAHYSEENPMIIETYFPSDYSSAELAGKTAWFEVTVEMIDGEYNMTEYNAPELTESFLTETLKITESDLSGYEGETLVEKYRAKLREKCVKENIPDVDTAKENAFWMSVMAGAVVKKYPEKELADTTAALIEQVESTYESSYYAFYYTLDQFGCLYFGIDYGEDWRAAAGIAAKDQIKQQLILYHIMNVEGLKPSSEEYDVLFDEYLTEALKSQNIIPERYDTVEQYNAQKEEYKNQIIEKNGEDYFKTIIYYKLAMEAILSYGEIIEIH